jgi:hypothetical protein
MWQKGSAEKHNVMFKPGPIYAQVQEILGLE